MRVFRLIVWSWKVIVAVVESSKVIAPDCWVYYGCFPTSKCSEESLLRVLFGLP